VNISDAENDNEGTTIDWMEEGYLERFMMTIRIFSVR